jgi:RNA methyltransferase, TrmH family
VTTDGPQFISSAGNALLKDLRRLAQDSTAYRKQGRVWIEGDHLCRAALARGVRPQLAALSQSAWHTRGPEWAHHAVRVVVIDDALFAGLSSLESPASMGFVVDLPSQEALRAGVSTVILDRVQDAGNVGAILRCAAAFGFPQVAAIKGTAGLWSPKVVRAAMGAHFALHLVEALGPETLDELGLPLIATSSHRGEWLHRQPLPWPCAWLFGHEGQGLSALIEAKASLSVRIVQPGGEESLNVASAAAICLHASASSAAESGPGTPLRTLEKSDRQV